MRVLKEFRTPTAKISIFSFNEKWIVKCEAGYCEQTFKFNQDEFELPEVEEICRRPGFNKRLEIRFQDMHREYANSFSD
jgi:hypothetical protein